MQKYGKIVNGNLVKSKKPEEGFKSIVTEQKDFDQSTHYLTETGFEDQGEHILIKTEIKELPLQEPVEEVHEYQPAEPSEYPKPSKNRIVLEEKAEEHDVKIVTLEDTVNTVFGGAEDESTKA